MEISAAAPPALNETAGKVTGEITVKPNETSAPAEPAQSAPAPQSQAQRLAGLLQSYGYKATEQNINMLNQMLENAIPLTKENVARMNQAMRLTTSAEKGLFLLRNGIPLTQANAAQLEGLVSGGMRITEQIQSLLEAVSELDDPALKTQILRILSAVQGADISLGVNGALEPTAQNTAYANADGLTPEGQFPGLNAESAAGNTPANGTDSQLAAGNPLAAETANPSADGNPTSPEAANPSAAGNPTSPETANPSAAGNPPAAAAANPSVPVLNTTASAEAVTPNANGELSSNPTGDFNAASPNPSASETAVNNAPANGNMGAVRPGGANPQSPTASVNTQNTPDTARPAAASAPLPARDSSDSPDPARLRLSFRLENSRPEDIDRFVNSLRDALRETQRVINNKQNDSPEAARVVRQTQTLSAHIDFVSQIKDTLFVQLPVFYNGQESLTDLHIYKDGGKKEKQSKTGGSRSALIALDTVSMGRFETYVQKNGASVSCQFRLRDKTVEQLVQRNVHRLESLLRAQRYSLDAFSFLPPGEPYTVLDSPTTFDEKTNAADTEKIFIFDQKI